MTAPPLASLSCWARVRSALGCTGRKPHKRWGLVFCSEHPGPMDAISNQAPFSISFHSAFSTHVFHPSVHKKAQKENGISQ